MKNKLSAVLAGLVILGAAAYLYARVGPSPYPGQRLNRSGSGFVCDADCDTGWECGDTDDICKFECAGGDDFAFFANGLIAYDGSWVYLGTGSDYKLGYNASGTQLELWTTDDDGGGTDGLCMSVDDGTDDVDFAAAITVAETITATGSSALNGGITVDSTNFTVNGTTGAVSTASSIAATGDITSSGGAGAFTCGTGNCSILAYDNVTNGLDIGSTGQTAMIRLATTNSAETVEMRVGTALTGIYETFGEGSGKGLTTMQFDMTATDGTAGMHNCAYVGGGNVFGYVAIGDNAADDIDMTANGLNIANDQADNEGREIFSGYGCASGRPMVVGTDAAFFFLTSVRVGDVSGTDTLFCGLKKLEVHNADVFAYDTYFGLGWNTSANPAAIKVIEELNGADAAQTDTTDTIADVTVLQMKILVDGSGNATAEHDADVPGTLEAPDATSAFQFDDGDLLVPICTYLEHNAGGLADTVDIGQWIVGYQ